MTQRLHSGLLLAGALAVAARGQADAGGPAEPEVYAGWVIELLDRDFDAALTTYSAATGRDRPLAVARALEIELLRGDGRSGRLAREIRQWLPRPERRRAGAGDPPGLPPVSRPYVAQMIEVVLRAQSTGSAEFREAWQRAARDPQARREFMQRLEANAARSPSERRIALFATTIVKRRLEGDLEGADRLQAVFLNRWARGRGRARYAPLPAVASEDAVAALAAAREKLAARLSAPGSQNPVLERRVLTALDDHVRRLAADGRPSAALEFLASLPYYGRLLLGGD